MSDFKKHLQDADSEMKANWRYVPFDMAGDFLQTIPMPGKANQFITVQPYCHKTIDQNFQIGVVKNKDYDKKKEEQKVSVKTDKLTQEKADKKK